MWQFIEKKTHLRHALFYEYNRQSSASQAHENINNAYGKGTIGLRTVFDWFAKFRNEIYDLDDVSRPGRPDQLDESRLAMLLQDDSRQTTRELAAELGCGQTTVIRHLEVMGYTQKLGIWIPHKLTEINKNQRVIISAAFLKRHQQAVLKHRPFLSQIVTGDEKWCLYVNFNKRKGWVQSDEKPTPNVKPDLHPKKTMLCVWWNMDGPVHWELLSRGISINASLYCSQLRRVAAALQEKYPNSKNTVLFLHDNARPHVAKATKTVLEELGWEVLLHPAYSPDLAPSDFHLFLSLSSALRGVSFDDEADLQIWLQEWFASKDRAFYRHGIEKLVERWTEVINSGGEYIGS